MHADIVKHDAQKGQELQLEIDCIKAAKDTQIATLDSWGRAALVCKIQLLDKNGYKLPMLHQIHVTFFYARDECEDDQISAWADACLPCFADGSVVPEWEVEKTCWFSTTKAMYADSSSPEFQAFLELFP